MQNPVRYVIIFYQIKNLSFINVAGVCPGMENAVSVKRKRLAVPDLITGLSTYSILAEGGTRRETLYLIPIKPFSNL
jgi:hypothetical protein